jgi:hypothetical protein
MMAGTRKCFVRRWLAYSVLLVFLLGCLAGCGEKEIGKKTEVLPPGRIPQDPKTKK